jgi:uncharacterized membrane protein YqjE
MVDCLVLFLAGLALVSLNVGVSRALAVVYRLQHLRRIGAIAAILAVLGAAIWLARCGFT